MIAQDSYVKICIMPSVEDAEIFASNIETFRLDKCNAK